MIWPATDAEGVSLGEETMTAATFVRLRYQSSRVLAASMVVPDCLAIMNRYHGRHI
jgi:hypothetical protein